MTERAMPEGDLRTLIAKAALDEAAYDALGDGWVDAKRLPDGVDPDDWACELVTWDQANDEWRENGYRIADAVLAVLRPHLGLGVTEDERTVTLTIDELEWLKRKAFYESRMNPENHVAKDLVKKASDAIGREQSYLRAIAGRGEVEGMNHE